MSAVLGSARPHARRPAGSEARAPQVEHALAGAFDGLPSSAGFAALLNAYRHSGGMTRGDDLAKLLKQRQAEDGVSLARLMGSGSVFGFKWRQTLWIPRFQFDALDWSVKGGLREVLSELAGVFDRWNLARWFAAPHPCLDDLRPADALDDDWSAVLHAAHACRSPTPIR